MEQIEAAAENNQTEKISIVEPNDIALVQALLFAHGEPLAAAKIAVAASYTEEFTLDVLTKLTEQLNTEASGLELTCIGGLYQLRTKPVFSEQVRRLKASAPKKLSNPALETLAIVAYRQPIVKSDMERIRGVDVTPTIKTLLERGLIKIVGHQASVGQPALYGTTDEFLQLFGLGSLTELPTLRDLKEIDAGPAEEETQEVVVEHSQQPDLVANS